MEQTAEAGSEQVQPVAETTTQAVADFDLSTPEGVRQAAEKYPAMKAVFADYANTEKQRALSEMRRERGSEEAVKAYHANIVNRLAAGEKPEDISKDIPLYVKANRESVEMDIYQKLYETAKAQDPTSVEALDAFATQEGLTVDQWRSIASAAVNAVANSSKKSALSEWMDSEDIEDIPEDSKRIKALKAKFEREMQMELKAREIEDKKVPAVAPSTPTGDNIEPMTRERLDSMTSDERMKFILSKSDAEREALWELAVS